MIDLDRHESLPRFLVKHCLSKSAAHPAAGTSVLQNACSSTAAVVLISWSSGTKQ